MTATDVVAEPKTAQSQPAWRHALLFGTGFGIAVGARNLEVALVRIRPSGAKLIAETTVTEFRSRPAAEWGSELLRFLAASGESRLAATVLLPRDEVIVRTLNLPGVADKDIPAAIELQIETLHPWGNKDGRDKDGGDEEVAWGWSRAGAATVVVGLVRKTLLDSYETLFSEAGVQLAAVTFSAAALHASLRLWNAPPSPVLRFFGQARIEVYGESEGRALYSAEFGADRERALAVARAELRLPQDYPANALTAPANSPLAWAAALARGRFANLLPPERRASHDRMQYLFPIVLGCLLLAALIVAFVVFPAIEERRYRDELNQAVRSLEPSALRAQMLEKRIIADRSGIAALDDFRRRPQADLDVLDELTRLLPPPIWTSAIEIYPDSVVIAGEAEQAAPLLKILDSSPLFQNSEFASSVTRTRDTEQFHIKTMRRGRAGRATP